MAVSTSIGHEVEERASWTAMVAIAFGQAIMSFNVASLPVALRGMVESFGVAPTVVATGIVAYSMIVAGFVMLGGEAGPAFRCAARVPAGGHRVRVVAGAHDFEPQCEATSATPEQKAEALRINTEARLLALKIGFLIMAGLALLTILPAGRLPDYRPGEIPEP